MASVGGLACTFVRGSAPSNKERVSVWAVPGLDGYGAHLQGLGDSEFRFRVVNYSSPAGVHTWAGLIEAMQGTVIAIVNDWAETWTGFLVLRVSPPRITAEYGNLGARGEIEIEGVTI